MKDAVKIKAVEMTRGIRDAHYAELAGKTPEERITFYREKARALFVELGQPDEVPQDSTTTRGRAEHGR